MGELVRAEDLAAFELQELPHLEGERLAGIVVVAFERHPQEPNRLVRETVLAELLQQHARETLIDEHRILAERKLVIGEGSQLHRVFEQARSGGETSTGKAAHAWIVERDGAVDARVVQAVFRAKRVELISGSKGNVPPCIAEQLAQLSFLGRELDHRRRDQREQRLRTLQRAWRDAGDDLRQLEDLAHGMTLRHSLGAKSDVDPRSVLFHPSRKELGGAG